MLSNHVIRLDENKLKSNPDKTKVMLIKKIWSDLSFAFCKEKAGLLGVRWNCFGKGYNTCVKLDHFMWYTVSWHITTFFAFVEPGGHGLHVTHLACRRPIWHPWVITFKVYFCNLRALLVPHLSLDFVVSSCNKECVVQLWLICQIQTFLNEPNIVLVVHILDDCCNMLYVV